MFHTYQETQYVSKVFQIPAGNIPDFPGRRPVAPADYSSN
jgi:hypothetical protein